MREELSASAPEPREVAGTASTSGRGRRGPALLPAPAVVLLLTAAAGVLVASRVPGPSGATSSLPGSWEQLLFALGFNAFIASAFAVVAFGEGLASAVRLVRRQSPARVAARFVVSLLPLAVLGVGHLLVNPWLVALVGQARRLGQLG